MFANELLPPYRKWWRAVVFGLGLGLLSGCGVMSKSMAELPLVDKSVGQIPNPVGDLPAPVERTWPDPAQDVLNQRARSFGLVNAPEMQRYLNALYSRLKAQAGVPAWPGTVHILANDALNAYATGAGNIYVSLPWLKSVESEDELVALLSHEFGHIYLHYHQLEGAVEDANTAAGLIGAGVAIAKKTGQATGWNQLDSMATAYMLGRGLLTTLYSRSQESAADHFGLNLSLKLGYSYEHGMKAFLERIASWEERNEAREKERQEQLLKAIRQQATENALKANAKQSGNTTSHAITQSTGEFSGAINSALQQLAFDINKTSTKLRSDHPETGERIDALALTVESLPEIQISADPITTPLNNALKEKRTAAIFKNYDLAFKAINAPKDPASFVAARNAVKAPTATHAIPLLALYTVMNEQPSVAGKMRSDPGQVLEANFQSEPDRAWKIYQERSARLKERGQTGAAKKIMESGLGYFQNAEDAWPDAIRFYGETQGWDEAKRMAAYCGKNFRRVSSRCTQAATSPSEQADAERKSKAKADQIVEKMFKKK